MALESNWTHLAFRSPKIRSSWVCSAESAPLFFSLLLAYEVLFLVVEEENFRGSCLESHSRARSMLISSAVAASRDNTGGTILRRFRYFSIRSSPTWQPVSSWNFRMTSVKLFGSSRTICSDISSLTTSLSKVVTSGKKSESKSSGKSFWRAVFGPLLSCLLRKASCLSVKNTVIFLVYLLRTS